MSEAPLLCLVHDDAGVRELLMRDLQERFGAHYVLDALADAAFTALQQYAADGRRVAAVFTADTAAGGGGAL